MDDAVPLDKGRFVILLQAKLLFNGAELLHQEILPVILVDLFLHSLSDVLLEFT